MISSQCTPLRVLVFGAGSVGCYLGGRLAAAGARVHFVGRARIGAELAGGGLVLSDYHGGMWHVAPDQIHFCNSVSEAPDDIDAALVTVKTAATPEAGRTLAAALRPGVPVVAFQNGLHNGAWLRELMPAQRVFAGMVPFNVLHRGSGCFHQGSSGGLAIEVGDRLAGLEAAFAAAGLPLAVHQNFRGVLWSKLLLNLNNAVNALAGVPLREEFAQRDFRRCLAAAQREALLPLSIAGIRLERLLAVSPRWMPAMLELPDWVYRRVSTAAPAMDPLARSSMWEDLEAGRATEVEWINGEVIRLARSQGRDAPVNARLMQLVYEAERGGERAWRAADLWADLQRVRAVSKRE
ncbi:MAG: 2-dehydropantoate 2-reductase [Nevskiaceae bacterium]|nr:MAG: 2-dehydropantoate 2-reductase [Nevskiaceae bacterium]TBR71357.1 MAG: 2-dehydropantoate 2-reductase [Nevskiaceae bacterium]